CGQHSHWPYSF
nr:immunoglobulin light chain junction region [Macaca mulatta]MOW41851.1 immunoglobulin light chain junction region [Macaca mulatta]MOW42444.1 immunoglobulin light chain junction region [Macaca mulatta]MOW42582.1 immunoglobulin light chain junction region [Macaca mulatta]MOW42905.1 immunoglobulin light chain junction region [Macaca mulatta]